MDFQELPIYGNEFPKYGNENRHKKKKGNNFLSSVLLLLDI